MWSATPVTKDANKYDLETFETSRGIYHRATIDTFENFIMPQDDYYSIEVEFVLSLTITLFILFMQMIILINIYLNLNTN